ncbi:MAG TPA: hypothetical protein VEM13_10940 [Gemmatimonadales bacterium]|nr:hypothetical protein [Gemmatimonadales bacterium]
MSAVLLALLALQSPIDEGSLVVREDTVDIARESFRLTVTRAGWTLAATTRYDRGRPVVVLDPLLEIGPDSAPATLEYTVADPREPLRILGQLTRGRFSVRLLGRRTERAREFPAPPPAAILDDSVFALYVAAAWRARPQPVPLTGLFPRAGRREVLMVQDLGIQSTTLHRDPASLRHITVTGGANRVVDLWLGPDGRLLKVEVPSRHLTAERAPAP